MRTGADYRDALRDGRKVFVMGEGRVDDVTTHPATSAMVEQYVAWYDRHFDPRWADTCSLPPACPWAFVLPKTSAEAVAIGRCIQETILLSAGNITHTPLYGHLIALGVLTAAETRNAGPHHAANAMAYRDMIADHGTVPDVLRRCGGHRPTDAARSEETGYRSNGSVKPTRAWWCAAGSACTPAQPTPRTFMSAP